MPLYVVLTFDPQGQGLSDTFGTGRDVLEGTPVDPKGDGNMFSFYYVALDRSPDG